MKSQPPTIPQYFDHSNEYLYSFADKDFRIIKANSLFLQKFGLQSNDYIGRPFHEVIHLIEAGKILLAGKTCLNEPGTVIKIEVNIKASSGEENWFQWEISSCDQDDKGEKGIQIIGIDITERKRSEKQLLYQAVLLDNIAEAVISLDENLAIKGFNKAAEKIYNTRVAEVKGKLLSEVFAINKSGEAFKHEIDQAAQNSFWKGQLCFRGTREEKEICHSFSITNVKDGNGDTIGYIAVRRKDSKEPFIEKTAGDKTYEHYQKIIEEVSDYAIFSLNKKGIIIDWTKGAEKIKGYSADEIVGKHVRIFYTKEDKDKNLPGDLLDKAAKTGKAVNEGWRVKKSGEVFWASVNIKALYNTSGEITGFLKVTRDLTERKVAETQVKGLEKKLKHVLSGISEGFFILDKNCRLIVGNKAAKKIIKRISGKRPEEKHSVLDSLPEEKQKALQFYVDKTFQGIKSEYESFYSVRNKGVWFNLSYSPIRDENKQVVGACIVARDVTEQKNAEKELDKSQMLFKTFMANTPAMGWIIDEEHKFRYLNKTYKNNFNLTEAAIGKSIYRIFPKSVCDSFIENNRRAWDTGSVIETIEEGVGPGGEKQIYQIYKFPLGEENGLKLLGGVALDITEQRNLQQKLAEEEKKRKREIIQAIIDAQEKERSELAYELHDNVNQILSSSKLMLEVITNSNQANIEFVRKSNEYIDAAIKELRRISHNLSPGILKDISLEAAIEDILTQINNSGKLHISYRKRNYTKGNNTADSGIQLAVLRIAQEQLNNIIKHAEATEVILQLFVTKTRIVLSIKDNGKGFDTTKVKKGLGLHNIFNRTEYYQGMVELKSEPLKGCLLKIEIPLSQ